VSSIDEEELVERLIKERLNPEGIIMDVDCESDSIGDGKGDVPITTDPMKEEDVEGDIVGELLKLELLVFKMETKSWNALLEVETSRCLIKEHK
jgi:hypothetical protein